MRQYYFSRLVLACLLTVSLIQRMPKTKSYVRLALTGRILNQATHLWAMPSKLKNPK